MIWQQRQDVRSWGRPASGSHFFVPLADRLAPLPAAPQDAQGPVHLLAYGNGRSYGDSCLNTGQALLGTRGLDRFIAFDTATGVLSCEAGVLLADILPLVVPVGWFLPVLPGTRFLTVGGAIANDVHGKNHHIAGSFGCHVLSLELLRSDGARLECSPACNADLFAATIGGLGLTGLVTRATLQLQRVLSPWMRVSSRRFGSLREFADMTQEAESAHEHVVAWLDTSGASIGQGLLMQANHTEGGRSVPVGGARLAVPFTPPFSLVSRPVVRAFNAAYLRRVPAAGCDRLTHAYAFMFPLDGIRQWSRIYGPRGFYQYQCLVPEADAQDVMAELLARIARSGQCSFLSVLKRMGMGEPPGLLSFAREGWTLALDFPDTGMPTLRLFDQLDAVVAAVGGRLYPAKDARMSARMFQQGFPKWTEFVRWVDPAFSSSFWRRVMAG